MTESLSIPDMWRDYTLKALNTSCCIKRAALRLGVDERTIYHWKKEFGIVWDSEEGKFLVKSPKR